MIALRPPRAVELLLESLGAKPEFRESLLGDLAQEFSERAERDGFRAARIWYYREAIHATPHLLRSWSRGLHVRDVTHLFGIALSAWVTILMLALLIVGMVRSAMWALGFSLISHVTPRDPLIYAIVLMLGLISMTVGGYVAAWLDGKAPLVAAFATGAIWSCVNISAQLIAPDLVPIWYRIGAPIALILSATFGGVLRVYTARFSDADQDSLPAGGPSSS